MSDKGEAVMTREEEIKSKMARRGVNPKNMDSDMAYLLARNEELQRRVELLEKQRVVDHTVTGREDRLVGGRNPFTPGYIYAQEGHE